jgi:hypothetical protein
MLDIKIKMWKESKTCWYSLAAQCTPEWDKLHVGCISASRNTTLIGRSKFSPETPEIAALECVGLHKKSFDSKALDRMSIGLKGEPIIRDWYSDYIGDKIEEVGIAVWKEDPRFRASLDGLYGGGTKGVEFKITKELYEPLSQHLTSSKNNHIWDTHYNQMIQCIAICGLDYIDYVVSSYNTNEVYIEKVYPDPERWKEIYIEGCKFLDQYVTPLMKEHGIERIDPY